MGGFRLVFERKCPFTLWVTDEELIEKVGHHIMQAEDLKVKILIKVSQYSSHSSHLDKIFALDRELMRDLPILESSFLVLQTTSLFTRTLAIRWTTST